MGCPGPWGVTAVCYKMLGCAHPGVVLLYPHTQHSFKVKPTDTNTCRCRGQLSRCVSHVVPTAAPSKLSEVHSMR